MVVNGPFTTYLSLLSVSLFPPDFFFFKKTDFSLPLTQALLQLSSLKIPLQLPPSTAENISPSLRPDPLPPSRTSSSSVFLSFLSCSYLLWQATTCPTVPSLSKHGVSDHQHDCPCLLPCPMQLPRAWRSPPFKCHPPGASQVAGRLNINAYIYIKKKQSQIGGLHIVNKIMQ